MAERLSPLCRALVASPRAMFAAELGHAHLSPRRPFDTPHSQRTNLKVEHAQETAGPCGPHIPDGPQQTIHLCAGQREHPHGGSGRRRTTAHRGNRSFSGKSAAARLDRPCRSAECKAGLVWLRSDNWLLRAALLSFIPGAMRDCPVYHLLGCGPVRELLRNIRSRRTGP